MSYMTSDDGLWHPSAGESVRAEVSVTVLIPEMQEEEYEIQITVNGLDDEMDGLTDEVVNEMVESEVNRMGYGYYEIVDWECISSEIVGGW